MVSGISFSLLLFCCHFSRKSPEHCQESILEHMKDLSCKNCAQTYSVSDTDEAFYARMGFPAPVQCPPCRYQQRLVFRNERNLYRRKCTATGVDIVSVFSEDKSIPVYSTDYWWSDAWDPKSYGRDFDFSRPFFDQFKELFYAVPQLCVNHSQSENCEFTNQSQRNKDCYLIVASNHNKDCYHGMWYQNCKDCMDCLYLENSELCYEIVNGTTCYACTFSDNLENCSDCHYSRDCIGCKNCFGCLNLRNKEFYLFNQPYSKEEYFEKLKHLTPDRTQIDQSFLKFPRKYYQGKITENFSGDYVQEVKNCFEVFNVRHAENLKFCCDVWDARNCFDLTETIENDFCLELEGSVTNNDVAFSMKMDTDHFSRYSAHCYFSKNLFGCVGLRNSEYCILNKQYTKEAYEALIPRIVEHMKETGEWGRYFPSSISPYGYNETVAQDYFPLSKTEVLKQGYLWKEETQLPRVAGEAVAVCEVSGRAFKFIPQELEFYKKMGLPLPRKHPDVRHKERMARRNPRRLWQRSCVKCQQQVQSSYSPESPALVYCETCYLSSVD